MIFLTLFYEFFKIGLFTIGGGYAMIPLMTQVCATNGWGTTEQIMNMIAISESTPGPFALNMATFIGVEQAGILGGVISSLGVVAPSFIIILIIAKLSSKINVKNKKVQSVLNGVRPVVVALIAVAFVSLLIKNLFGEVISISNLDVVGLIIAVIITGILFLRKKTSIFTIILVSGLLGLIGYFVESLII